MSTFIMKKHVKNVGCRGMKHSIKELKKISNLITNTVDPWNEEITYHMHVKTQNLAANRRILVANRR